MQPVRGGEIAGAKVPGPNGFRILADLTGFALADPQAGTGGRVEQGAVQHRPAHPAPGAAPERCVDVLIAVAVADSPERLAVRMHSEAIQMPQGVRHQPLASRPVDRSAAPLDDDRV